MTLEQWVAKHEQDLTFTILLASMLACAAALFICASIQ